jgi:type III secretion system FlhB-like substrate exporter
MSLTGPVALAIVNEAKAGGYEDQPVPEQEAALIDRAEFWLAEARKAADQGMKNATVMSILRMGEEAEHPLMVVTVGQDGSGPEPQAEGPEAPVPEPEGPTQEEVSESEAAEATPPSVDTGKGAPAAPSEAPGLVERERLPVPPEMQGDPPEMPPDISALDDGSVRRLHGQLNAYLARVDYLVSQEELARYRAKVIRDQEYDTARRNVPKVDADGKRRLAEDIDVDARANDVVVQWDEKLQAHDRALIELKGLQAIYSRFLSVLSREWSMRTDEWQRVAGKGG